MEKDGKLVGNGIYLSCGSVSVFRLWLNRGIHIGRRVAIVGW